VRKRLYIAILPIILTVALAMSTQTTALPFDNEYTNQVIAAGEWWDVFGDLDAGDTLSGYFETASDTQGLKFFICDDGNYSIYESGGVADVYNLETNMHALEFSFTIPYDDTWHTLFSNDAGSTTVTVDIGVDVNDDNTPYYSPSDYEFDLYREVLEGDDWYYVWDTLDAGTEISGHYSTWFPTDGVDFFICDEENYNIWVGGGTADVYDLQEDFHQNNIGTFTVPYAGVWYCVFSALGEEDTVTLSFGIEIDTSGAYTSVGVDPLVLAGVGIAAVAIIGLIACTRSRGRRPDYTPPPQTGDYPSRPPPSDEFVVDTKEEELVLGAVKSYPRVSMTELANIVSLPVDEVRKMVLRMIAAGLIVGTFDRFSDEFTSASATEVVKDMRKDGTDIRALPACPHCSAPLTRQPGAGETVQCESCGRSFTA
jgi:hypothetical protein